MREGEYGAVLGDPIEGSGSAHRALSLDPE